MRLRPGWPNHVWAYGFVTDRIHGGRSFRMLTIIHEFTREWLAKVGVKTLFIERWGVAYRIPSVANCRSRNGFILGRITP